jgi:site-specific DNA-cytosine methylase
MKGKRLPKGERLPQSCRPPSFGVLSIWDTGFSCKLFSKANAERATLCQDTLDNKTGSSGETYDGLQAWVANERPLILIVENVPELLSANYTNWGKIKYDLKSLGYSVHGQVFDSAKYMRPFTRLRTWICAVYCPRLIEPTDPDTVGGTDSDKKRCYTVETGQHLAKDIISLADKLGGISKPEHDISSCLSCSKDEVQAHLKEAIKNKGVQKEDTGWQERHRKFQSLQGLSADV